jgi:hypothetical protein
VVRHEFPAFQVRIGALTMARRVRLMPSARTVKTMSGTTAVQVVNAVWRAMTALSADAGTRR